MRASARGLGWSYLAGSSPSARGRCPALGGRCTPSRLPPLGGRTGAVATVAAAAAWQRCPAAVLAGCGRRWKVLRATPRRLRGAELLQRVFMRRLRRQQSDCIGVMKVNGSGNEHACLERAFVIRDGRGFSSARPLESERRSWRRRCAMMGRSCPGAPACGSAHPPPRKRMLRKGAKHYSIRIDTHR